MPGGEHATIGCTIMMGEAPMHAVAAIRSVVLLSASLALSACGLGGPAHGPPEPNAAAVVDMGFESYTPATVSVRAGQTVEWRNTALIAHTVTDDPRLAKNPKDAALPAGAAAFDSGEIPAGQVFTYTFATPGTYRYFCRYHEADGMLGTVVVTPAS
jgi:plastocyanin